MAKIWEWCMRSGAGTRSQRGVAEARVMLAADVPAFYSVASTSVAVAACTVTEGAVWSRLKVSAVLPALALPATSVSCTLRLFEPSAPRATAATLMRTLPD